MGSVGSFHRIQEFLGTDIRIDSRTKPELIFSHFSSYQSSQIKSAYSSEVTILGTEKSSLVGTPQEGDLAAIIIRDGSFGWHKENGPLLESINMTVPKGKMTMLVGPVGCGKSTLIMALLGEAINMAGSVQLSSLSIAFCDQTPWHMNGSIQESIIGISKLDELWYASVINACALDEDLRQLSRGDQTVIGSKGIALSGGQSQRIVSPLPLVKFPEFFAQSMC
jgi:ATP-binding cassette subfamily C (CFTR/MRP) protein 1